MVRFLKYLSITVFFSLFILPPAGVQADTPQPFEVLSMRVEKSPESCQTTLFVTIKNNSQTTSDSGLFVRATQFKNINGQTITNSVGNKRLDNLPAGQTREISYNFIRSNILDNISFRFKVVADTITYVEKSLPSVTVQYSGKIISPVFDKANNKITGSVINQGSEAIPKPSIQLLIAPPDSTSDFHAGGGGEVCDCLAPGESATFSRPVQSSDADSLFKVRFLVEGTVLNEKILNNQPLINLKTIEKLSPINKIKEISK